MRKKDAAGRACGLVLCAMLTIAFTPWAAFAQETGGGQATGLQAVTMGAQADAWDGTQQTEPAKQGGVYQIGTGAELAKSDEVRKAYLGG